MTELLFNFKKKILWKLGWTLNQGKRALRNLLIYMVKVWFVCGTGMTEKEKKAENCWNYCWWIRLGTAGKEICSRQPDCRYSNRDWGNRASEQSEKYGRKMGSEQEITGAFLQKSWGTGTWGSLCWSACFLIQ